MSVNISGRTILSFGRTQKETTEICLAYFDNKLPLGTAVMLIVRSNDHRDNWDNIFKDALDLLQYKYTQDDIKTLEFWEKGFSAWIGNRDNGPAGWTKFYKDQEK